MEQVEQPTQLAEGEVEENPEMEAMISSLDKIMEARTDVMLAEAEEAKTKKAHAAAKATLEKAWGKLGEVIDEQKKSFEPNLFNSGYDKDAKEDESWREVFIGDIGLPTSVSEKLIEGGINSMGLLSDWSNSEKTLTDIKGIGTATAEQIQDCLTEFWKKRNDKEAAKKAAAEAAKKDAATEKPKKAGKTETEKQAEIVAAGLAAMGNPFLGSGPLPMVPPLVPPTVA